MSVTAESKLDREFERLYRIFSNDRFLNMEGLGNEVPFFIWPFDPALQNAVDKSVPALIRRLRNEGLRVLTIDLFDLAVEALTARGKFQKILKKEPEIPKQRFLKILQPGLDSQNVLAPAMVERVQSTEHDMVFVTGVGLVFPFIRTHNLLNNIQRVFKEHPLVVFFPGEYRHTPASGSTLNLFGCMPDDRYYRAFDLNEYKI